MLYTNWECSTICLKNLTLHNAAHILLKYFFWKFLDHVMSRIISGDTYSEVKGVFTMLGIQVWYFLWGLSGYVDALYILSRRNIIYNTLHLVIGAFLLIFFNIL
jgi:hypothetical protein